MDDVRTTIAYAVSALATASQAEAKQPHPRPGTLAAMGIAEGTLRTVAGVLDFIRAPAAPAESLYGQREEIAGSEISSWQTLGNAVVARRHWLSMTQPDVRNAGGPSEQTQRRIENAQRGKYKTIVFLRLETALRWPKGTIAKILNGTITDIDEVITAPWGAQHAKESTT